MYTFIDLYHLQSLLAWGPDIASHANQYLTEMHKAVIVLPPCDGTTIVTPVV